MNLLLIITFFFLFLYGRVWEFKKITEVRGSHGILLAPKESNQSLVFCLTSKQGINVIVGYGDFESICLTLTLNLPHLKLHLHKKKTAKNLIDDLLWWLFSM